MDPIFAPQEEAARAPLRLVQEELGCIAPETAREVAEIFRLHPREVMEVVSFYGLLREAPAGRHEVMWRATNLPSGLYLVRMRAGAVQKVQRVMLVK